MLQGRGYRFNEPSGIASDGTHVWVASYASYCGNSVTEIDAATGALVKVLRGRGHGFNEPDAVATDGTHVWVTNSPDNSMTEFPA